MVLAKALRQGGVAVDDEVGLNDVVTRYPATREYLPGPRSSVVEQHTCNVQVAGSSPRRGLQTHSYYLLTFATSLALNEYLQVIVT